MFFFVFFSSCALFYVFNGRFVGYHRICIRRSWFIFSAYLFHEICVLIINTQMLRISCFYQGNWACDLISKLLPATFHGLSKIMVAPFVFFVIIEKFTFFIQQNIQFCLFQTKNIHESSVSNNERYFLKMVGNFHANLACKFRRNRKWLIWTGN